MEGGNKTQRLSGSYYKRPEKTHQESLSNAEITEKLKDYKKVVDITKVSIGSHLRYYTTDLKTNKKVFRLGGTLNKFGENGEYLILSNGKITWSVQIKNSIFFQKLNEKEIKAEMKADMKEELKAEMKKELKKDASDEHLTTSVSGGQEINVLKKELKNLIKENDDIKKEYSTMLKENSKLMSRLADIEKAIKKEKKKEKNDKK